MSVNDLWQKYKSKSESLIDKSVDTFVQYTNSLKQGLITVFREYLFQIKPDWPKIKGQELVDIIGMDNISGMIDTYIDDYEDAVVRKFGELTADTMDMSKQWGEEIGVASNVHPTIRRRMIEQSLHNDYSLINVTRATRNDIMQIVHDAIVDGLDIDGIANRLREWGQMEESPTGRFSPEERIRMIAHEEYRRIFSSINERLAAEAGLGCCYNELNRALRTHSPVCVASSSAGVISRQKMRTKYGFEPRHVGCGCTVQFVRCGAGDDGKTKSDLAYIEKQGMNVKELVSKFEEA